MSLLDLLGEDILSPRQEDVILDAIDSPAAIVFSDGSVSGGKTFSTNLAWAAYVEQAPPGPLAMIGKTHDALTRNVIDPMRDVLGDGCIVHTRGANVAAIMGRLVHVLGANDRKAEDKIRGLTLAGAYVDEASLLPKGYWDMLLTRLRVPRAKLFATTNPDHPRHPLKLDVLDKADGLEVVVHHFLMSDNPSLDPAYVARMERSFTGLFYDRFIRGLWVAATGAIYGMVNLGTTLEPGPHRIARDNVTLDPARARIGLDYGTANATHVVLGIPGIRRSDGRHGLVIAGEWVYSGRDNLRALTDAEQSAAIRTWLASGGADPGPGKTGLPVSAWSTVRREVVDAGPIAPTHTYVDPAAASFKTQLRRDGVTGVRDAHNAVLDGLRTTGSLYAADRLWFLDGAAPVLEGQTVGYVWDDDPAVDAPAKDQEDHGCDGKRYMVMGSRDVWRPWLSDAAPDPDTQVAHPALSYADRMREARRRAAG